MISRNTTVFVTGGTKKLTLDEPFLTRNETTIQLKQATVFWNFKNVTSTNKKYAIDTTEKEISEGYWDFELIKERLKIDKINLTAIIPNNTRDVQNKNGKTVNLKNLGKLLGFPANENIPHDTVLRSPNAVDVNRGLRYTLQLHAILQTQKEMLTQMETQVQTLPIYPFLPVLV